MKAVFSNIDGALLGLYQSILDEAGIPYSLRNGTSVKTGNAGFASGITEMPSLDFWPTLYVLRDEDWDQAHELLLAATEAPPLKIADWECSNCRQTVPATFTSCWNCGRESLPPPLPGDTEQRSP
jgi:hypothetical protein